MLRLKLMLSAIAKNRFDGVDAGFRVAVQGLGKGGVRGQAVIAKSVIVSGDRIHGQACVLKERCAADLAGNHFDQRAIGPIDSCHVRTLIHRSLLHCWAEATGRKTSRRGSNLRTGAFWNFRATFCRLAVLTSFRNFDLQKQKVKLMQLSVAGSETVTVPAGTFTAFRVEVTSADGSDKSTVWIAKDSRKAVKMSTIMASMGGATMTAELQAAAVPPGRIE
jgi:hypothetical protein